MYLQHFSTHIRHRLDIQMYQGSSVWGIHVTNHWKCVG